jgi:two-component system, OmpR family, response regulator
MKRKRILVVDDEVGFTRLLKLNLEHTSNYDVRVVNWAEDALPAAREFRPDVVLLDVIMPRLAGGDVAACLWADASLKQTPIVFFTAAVSRTRVKEHDGLIDGFPLLAKPASVEEIIDRIEHVRPKEGFVALTPFNHDSAPQPVKVTSPLRSPDRAGHIEPSPGSHQSAPCCAAFQPAVPALSNRLEHAGFPRLGESSQRVRDEETSLSTTRS